MAVSSEPLEPLALAAPAPVIPVIVLERADDAVPLARALVAGGVRVLELTLRTQGAEVCDSFTVPVPHEQTADAFAESAEGVLARTLQAHSL